MGYLDGIFKVLISCDGIFWCTTWSTHTPAVSMVNDHKAARYLIDILIDGLVRLVHLLNRFWVGVLQGPALL